MTHPTPHTLPRRSPMAESFGQMRFVFRAWAWNFVFSVAGSRAEVKFRSQKTTFYDRTFFTDIEEPLPQGPGKRLFPSRAASNSKPHPTTPPPAPPSLSAENAHRKVKTLNLPPGLYSEQGIRIAKNL